ncbi:hypothetical protein ABZ946_20120 [Streptomyces sp. NPDC046324]
MSVSEAGRIDIAGPVGKLLHRRPLKNSTVMQLTESGTNTVLTIWRQQP